MQIIVASDIHGANADLRGLLAGLGAPTILSPWSGDDQPYASEQEAVSAFHRDDGLSAYERKIADSVKDQPAFLIGFSVGATSLWRYIASRRCNPDSQAVLYYGSRIRDYVALAPRCPTSVIFAAHEPSFDPKKVAREIAKPPVSCSILQGTHHGFMNPRSNHYREDVALDQLQLLADMVQNWSGSSLA